MAEKIEMPQLSDTMEAGTIVKWFVEEGERVERGDVIAEVETDKATMDLEAFDDGVLLKKMISEGEEVPTQSTIAIIGEEGEDVSELLEEEKGEDEGSSAAGEPGETEDEEETKKGQEVTEPTPTADDRRKSEQTKDKPESAPASESTDRDRKAETVQQEPSASVSPSDSSEDRLRASPVARRIAADRGVDLRRVEGSGPGGRIIKKDVFEVLERGGAGMASVSGGKQPKSKLREEQRPLSGMRRTIAERMSDSNRNVPHFFLEQDVEMEQVVELVESLKNDERNVNLNDFILMAAARALNEVPRMNSSYREDHVKLFGQVNLGFAVAVEDGLLTPVIDRAETKSVEQLHRESQELIEKARSGNLKPDEYRGATFTVSNLGMFGIPNFSAVINPPEAGILAVGEVDERPVANSGSVTTRPQMSVTLSCDHRAVDGAIGARYLGAFKELMESPARMYV